MIAASRVMVSWDEEYCTESRIAHEIEVWLKSLNIDTYNQRVVVRVTVDELAEPEDREEEDDND